MKNFSEMTGSEIRAALGIVSASDSSNFDHYDDTHVGLDYKRADERRSEIIDAIIDHAFCGNESELSVLVYSMIGSKEDEDALVNELVSVSTYAKLWDTVSESYQAPEDYVGVDAYVEAAKLELKANLHGRCADEEAVANLFIDNKSKIVYAALCDVYKGDELIANYVDGYTFDKDEAFAIVEQSIHHTAEDEKKNRTFYVAGYEYEGDFVAAKEAYEAAIDGCFVSDPQFYQEVKA